MTEPYAGSIAPGMVFDYEPGRKDRYERLTIDKKQGIHIWAWGRSGLTFYEESDFRKSVVFVSDKPLMKPKPAPLPLLGRYEGPVEPGMWFDFEPGKKHWYERIIIERKQGEHLWCRGRSGQTYYEEPDFRNHVVRVPSGASG
jgi:hypothetical protein